MYKKTGLIFFFFFLTQCSTSLSRIIKKKYFPAFVFSVSFIDTLPSISLETRFHQKKEPYEKNQRQTNPVNLKFVIDTGSNITLINEKLFSKRAKPSKKLTIKSLNAIEEIEYNENTVSLSVEGQDLLNNRTIYSAKFPEQFQFDGILGNDILSEFDVILNFPRAFILLKKDHSLQFEELGFQGVETDLASNYVVVDGFIDSSVPKKFMLDTGSGLSYISLKSEEKSKYLEGEKKLYFDALGKIQEGDTIIAKKFCILNQKFCQIDSEFLTDQNSFQLNLQNKEKLFGLIGMNWLWEKEIVISFSKKKIYFRNLEE